MTLPNLPGVPGYKPKQSFPVPRKAAVVVQPRTYQDLQKGINLLGEAIRPTLGPLPRLVVFERVKRDEAPEFLDDGATIARRIIQVKPRGCDVGLMLFRHALWNMHEEVGDGTTTMGVMYQTIFNEGVRVITEYGCNAMLLRTGLEKGLRAVRQALRSQAIPLIGKDIISLVAQGMCQGDRDLAEMLGEIFDIVGSDGLIVVEKGNRRGLEREYVEGTYWHLSGWFSRLFITDPSEKSVVFEDAALLISDVAITEPALLIPVLERCLKAGVKKVVIITPEISDGAIGLLVQNNLAKTVETMAVRIPRFLEMDRVAAIEDIAILTGGRPIFKAAETDFTDFKIEDLGYARRAWATESQFGVYGGKGDQRRIRQRIIEVRGQLQQAELESEKKQLQMRIGRLSGGTAILRIGGFTETESETRKEFAERAVSGLRNALLEGVVPGGGAALLQCQSVLVDLPFDHEDEALAYRILARALEEPMRVIANNAGYSADVVLDHVGSSPSGYGFDARSEQIVDLRERGILDSVRVLEKALEVAVSGAAMALTTDVIIHHKKPKETIEP